MQDSEAVERKEESKKYIAFLGILLAVVVLLSVYFLTKDSHDNKYEYAPDDNNEAEYIAYSPLEEIVKVKVI